MLKNAELMEWLRLLFVLAGGGLVGYAFNRRRTTDKRSDVVADAVADANVGLIETLQSDAKGLREALDARDRVIGSLSKERNAAVQEVGLLRGKVEALESEVHNLSRQVEALTAENHELHDHIMRMEVLAGEVREDVRDSMTAMRLSNEALLDALREFSHEKATQ